MAGPIFLTPINNLEGSTHECLRRHPAHLDAGRRAAAHPSTGRSRQVPDQLTEVPGLSYRAQWMRDQRALFPERYEEEKRRMSQWARDNARARTLVKKVWVKEQVRITLAEARRRLGLPPHPRGRFGRPVK